MDALACLIIVVILIIYCPFNEHLAGKTCKYLTTYKLLEKAKDDLGLAGHSPLIFRQLIIDLECWTETQITSGRQDNEIDQPRKLAEEFNNYQYHYLQHPILSNLIS